MIDHLTRYTWAFAMKRNDEAAMINIITNFLSAFGRFNVLITDNHKNFTGKKLNNILTRKGVEHRYVTMYNAPANGLCERVNGEIVKKLKFAVLRDKQENKKRKWNFHLHDVIEQINNTPHSSTDFSPNFLMFGISNNKVDPEIDLIEARKLAFEKGENEKLKIKQVYDEKHKTIDFPIDSFVRKKVPSNLPSNHKLTPKFSGPYKVIRKINDLNYTLESEDGHQFNDHVRHLEPYRHRI